MTSMWKYLPTLATSLLAIIQLAKDWGAHRTSWRRAAVLLLIVALGLGATINIYYSSKSNFTQHTEDQKQITALQRSVETANKAQDDNTKQFLQSFKDLSSRLANLQSQVKTAGLQGEADKLKKELEATQKALVSPKAQVEASLGEWGENLQNVGVKQLHTQKQGDAIAFTVSVGNKSSVQARNGFIFLRICKECEFVEEPERFARIPGGQSCDREMPFQALPATTTIAIPLKLRVPAQSNGVVIGVRTRCENCDASEMERLLIAY